MKRIVGGFLCWVFGLGLATSSLAASAEVDTGRNSAKAHTELGTAYFQGGRMATALEEANAAILADSTYAPAYNLAGLVHFFLRENDKARENFQRALSLSPNDSEVNNNYGWLLCQEGREKESFAYFTQAVKNPLYNAPTRSFYNAGMCALRLKDNALAEDYFFKALMYDQNNVQALYRLAELKYRANNLYEAQKLVNLVLRSKESDPAAIWLALRVERKLGNKKTETDLSTQLRRKFQGTPEYQAMMQGNFE